MEPFPSPSRTSVPRLAVTSLWRLLPDLRTDSGLPAYAAVSKTGRPVSAGHSWVITFWVLDWDGVSSESKGSTIPIFIQKWFEIRISTSTARRLCSIFGSYGKVVGRRVVVEVRMITCAIVETELYTLKFTLVPHSAKKSTRFK